MQGIEEKREVDESMIHKSKQAQASPRHLSDRSDVSEEKWFHFEFERDFDILKSPTWVSMIRICSPSRKT
jgi:hypothetical protein